VVVAMHNAVLGGPTTRHLRDQFANPDESPHRSIGRR
jgi:hypothetical protein